MIPLPSSFTFIFNILFFSPSWVFPLGRTEKSVLVGKHLCYQTETVSRSVCTAWDEEHNCHLVLVAFFPVGGYADFIMFWNALGQQNCDWLASVITVAAWKKYENDREELQGLQVLRCQLVALLVRSALCVSSGVCSTVRSSDVSYTHLTLPTKA